eukprot:scaffold34628_cov166-Amphora_coffeaeformis.AAC.4
MVKLNEDAFAAVNAAFPDAAKKASQTTATGSHNATTTGGTRKGVGASAVDSSASTGTSDLIHKRVLQIGSKKRKTLSQEEEEDQQGVERNFDDKKKPSSTNIDHDTDDDDDEEDLGRTAIDKESKRVANTPSLEGRNGDYRGRPLTAETRKRLNMTESRRETKLKAYWSNQNKSSGEVSDEAKH